MNGAGMKPSTLETKSNFPEPRLRIPDSTARVTRTAPKKFTSNNPCAYADG